MNTHRILRFSVGTLLIVTALLAITLGTAHWQRQQTFATYRQFHCEGVGLIMVVNDSDWKTRWGLGEFWARYPRTAEIYVDRQGFDDYRIGNETYSWEQAQERLLALKSRLYDYGIQDIHVVDYEGTPPPDFASPPPPGIKPGQWREVVKEHSRRYDQVIRFAIDNGMSSLGMDSSKKLKQRWQELAPK